VKPILVPTDFSDISIHAAHYAAALAADWGSDLILVHVQPLPLVISDIPLPYENYELSLEEAGLQMKDLEAALQARLPAGLQCSSQVLSGDFILQMKGLIREKEPPLIVMGKRGMGATEAFFMGSHAVAATRHLSCPILIVPKNADFVAIRKVGFACDMKNVMETVPFDAIRDLLEKFKASLDVLYVGIPGEEINPIMLSESKFIQNNLAAFRPEIHFSDEEDILKGFEDFIKAQHIDLLLLVPKKHGAVDSLFHISIAKKVVLNLAIPILALHE
jgi:nucleotide-binding universal stress UspA family protein